jgi:hypothetical protein
MKPTVICLGLFVAVAGCGGATPATVVTSPTTGPSENSTVSTEIKAPMAPDQPAPIANTEISAAAMASKDWPRITRSAMQKNIACAAAVQLEPIGSHPDHVGEQFHLYMRDGNAAYTSGGTMPDGAMIVKRSFKGDEAKGTTAYFLMYKRAGQNPGGGDWLYATTQANGEVIRAGVLADCAGCHDKQRDQDFLFRKY